MRGQVFVIRSFGAHFGVKPRDDRLQRPEYLGGSKNPVIISEVLQTSSTDATSAQGNLAGHGITVGNVLREVSRGRVRLHHRYYVGDA